GPVMDQGQEEGPERPPRGVERLGRPPQRQERVLDDLLGDQVLRRDAQRNTVGGPAVPPVQLVEGRPLASRYQPVQLEIVTIVLVHGLFPTTPGPLPPRYLGLVPLASLPWPRYLGLVTLASLPWPRYLGLVTLASLPW